MAAFAGGSFVGTMVGLFADDLPFGKVTAISFSLAGLCFLGSIIVD